jgi:hypothetical protein
LDISRRIALPFNGNGQFVRVHNWQSDAANGLDINAVEMDAEDNGIAAGLSNCVTRDGQGQMGADFLPSVDNTFNLGTASKRWATLNGVPVANLPVTQANIGAILTPQTPAEGIAIANYPLVAIAPVNFWYAEGDIRRYGAATSNATNHTYFNAALAVSSSQGNPAFVPGGTFTNTSPIVATPGSSMYGTGKGSQIVSANNIDGIQWSAADPGVVNEPRFFRDFALIGTQSGSANTAHGFYIDANTNQVLFSNIAISNYCWGVWMSGLEYSTFLNCYVQNCWQGFFFYQQSINVSILDCYAQLTTGGTLITAGSSGLTYSTGVSVQGTPEVEGLHIQGGSYYGYSYDFFLNLVFECQITAVDISAASVCPIFFTSVLGPLIIRDCWIELGAGASGTWNDKVTLGDGNLTGIFITAITPSIYNKVSIENNYIIADQPPACPAGSTGLYLGNSNVGLTVRSNHILGWDVGIGGGNTLTNVGGFLTAAVIKWNTINIVDPLERRLDRLRGGPELYRHRHGRGRDRKRRDGDHGAESEHRGQSAVSRELPGPVHGLRRGLYRGRHLLGTDLRDDHRHPRGHLGRRGDRGYGRDLDREPDPGAARPERWPFHRHDDLCARQESVDLVGSRGLVRRRLGDLRQDREPSSRVDSDGRGHDDDDDDQRAPRDLRPRDR